METAARAVHENYHGKNTWKAATPAERGQARQAVRLVQSALERAGVTLSPAPAPAQPVQGAIQRASPRAMTPPPQRLR